MLKKLFLLIILSTCIQSISSQNSTDSIKKVQFNHDIRYVQSGRMLNSTELIYLLSSNKTSLKYLHNFRTLRGFSNAVSYSGGFCIGYPIGYVIAGYKMNWSLFAMGCGFVVFAIPISIASNNKLKLAINTYNKNVKTRSGLNQLDVKLGCTQNGIGITLTL